MVNVTLFYRVSLFLIISAFTIFLGLRINKYPRNLRRLIILATVFSAIGTFGRFINLLALFINIPFFSEIHMLTHVVSVGGIIWTFILVIRVLENYYIPFTSSVAPKEGKSGVAYLTLSQDTVQKVHTLLQEFSEGPVLVFTRNPQRYNRYKNVKTAWVTTAGFEGVSPTALHILHDMAIRFVSENNNTTVIVDCLEYLIIYNGFRSVFKFLVSLKDHLVMRGATLILVVDPTTLKESELSLLRREFNPL